MKSLSLCGAAAFGLVLCGSVVPASASTIDWKITFSGQDNQYGAFSDVALDLTTSDVATGTLNGLPFYQVQGISGHFTVTPTGGTAEDFKVDGLLSDPANPSPSNYNFFYIANGWGYDYNNIIYPLSNPLVDLYGLGFTASYTKAGAPAQEVFNIYYQNGNYFDVSSLEDQQGGPAFSVPNGSAGSYYGVPLTASTSSGAPSGINVSQVPEPVTVALLGMGFAGFGMIRRRKKTA